MDRTKRLQIVGVIIAIIVVVSIIGYIDVIHPGTIEKGEEITVGTNVKGIHINKIVSLSPAATGTLYALGASSDIIAVGPYSHFPVNITRNIQEVTCYPSFSVQQIVKLNPDAVIASSGDYKQTAIQQLLDAGINYISLNSGSGSTFHLIEKQDTLLGKLTGTSQNASKLNHWMNESLNEFRDAKVQNKTIFYALCIENNKPWTSGNNTFVNSMFNYAHLTNIAREDGFYQASNEIVVKGNPQVLLLGTYVANSQITTSTYNSSPAYQNDSVFQITDGNIYSEPNFRDIFAIQDLIHSVYNTKVNIPPFPVKLEYKVAPNSTLEKIKT